MKGLKNKKIDNMHNFSTGSFLLFCLFYLFALFAPIDVYAKEAKEAIGWHWYNEAQDNNKKNEEENQEKQKNQKNSRKSKKSELSAMQQVIMLRQAVREAKAKAVLYPTEENVRSYIIMQNFVMNQANSFTHVWKKTLLDYPELDYSILHPTQNIAQHILYAENSRKELAAIKYFSSKYGLMFFYRGDHSLDKEVAPVVARFSKDHNVALIPVSMDGKYLDVFGTSKTNSGQAEKLRIRYFPALILVDPTTQKTIPLNYGFFSDSDLRQRFLQIATDFQEGI